jgi:sugar phosphate isomerase/epimerase
MDDTSYSTAGFRPRDTDSALDVIAKVGFPQAEISGWGLNGDDPLPADELAGFLGRLEQRGLRARTVHAPSSRITLGAPDEEWRKEAVGVLADYLRFVGDMGATDMVIHPIPNPIFVENAFAPEIPGLVGEAASRSLDDLIPVAEKAGVRMNLENLPYHCDYPYRRMKELRPLVDQYPAEQLGLIIDTGHVGVLDDDIVEEIQAAGSRLRGTHIHDVIGHEDGTDHRGPGRGVLDWDAMLAAFRDIDYPGPYTFETIIPNEGETQDELARFTREFAVKWGITA